VSRQAIEQGSQAELRVRAVARLTGRHDPGDTRANSSAALGVLYELASSPSTSADALALLHELQVHQVELEMQEEELQRSRVELEANLVRQIQLYDLAPFGYFTIDGSMSLCEMNLAGARLLGSERDVLLGRGLDSFLTPESTRTLHAMLDRIRDSVRVDSCTLQLKSNDDKARAVRACANSDSTGGRFLVALVDAGTEINSRG
jgi:PAS domain-containing protein